ncbi:hypothetical protein Acsp04_62960 [Actinomadura sp. NBRC 104425]|uniref:thiopeptide-type bacteriocin biosynthesis protein n=1 Tax=Actinomadura sp. NBRC 104425 TaxID=3032204 RepID=UPI0024A2C32A|nr:thiopeptide-type bacteriocin biosynthesis protein [Actinomadura sp. NBRC 104425]GLZ16061.1 hypothetical protein Acsp04_62960 [Actinomadura sp. NBRC 104425]
MEVDDVHSWRQLNVAFPAWTTAERTAVDHLAPLMVAAANEGLIRSWFFIRKAPCWRMRYLPATDPPRTETCLLRRLSPLQQARRIVTVTPVVYEPETHAFGGTQGMASAHRLFHLDSRHLLAYLADSRAGGGHRRALSVLLCISLLRGAGLDWYEQGDVWARVADHREPPGEPTTGRLGKLRDDLRLLMTVDAPSPADHATARAFTAGWADAFSTAGRELAGLAATAQLHRGLRAVLAHHIIFAWNRHGLPRSAQAALAHSAKTVVFGPDPTAEPRPQKDTEAWTTPAAD